MPFQIFRSTGAKQMVPIFYRTITGRRFDVSKLSGKERTLLLAVLRTYEKKPEWNQFASLWARKFDKAMLGDESPVYRICQDLEARLGIAQGKVSAPDLRDYIADLIEEKYGSRYRFCQEKGLDQGYLSRVLSGQTGLSLEAAGRILSDFDSVLVVRRREDLRADTAPAEAARMLATV
jgi:hypothetical protein